MAYSQLIRPLSRGRTKGFTGPLSTVARSPAMVDGQPFSSYINQPAQVLIFPQNVRLANMGGIILIFLFPILDTALLCA